MKSTRRFRWVEGRSAGAARLSSPLSDRAAGGRGRRRSRSVRALLGLAAVVLTAPALAADDTGYGTRPHDPLTLSPAPRCEAFEADSSPTGWTCDPEPDSRGFVESARLGGECFPTRVTMSYYYTTAAGVRRTLPAALVYSCKDGQLDGPYDRRWVVYSAAGNKADTYRETGSHLAGKRTGTWTFDGVTGTGARLLRTVRYEAGAEVGLARTTEGGKTVELACSSRVPAVPSRFWSVRVDGASAERLALAEKAAAECGRWSAALCEDYRQKGLFGGDVSCGCDAQCKFPGGCTLVNGVCAQPASDEDCARTEACAERGLCAFEGGTCAARTADNCKAAKVCVEGGHCFVHEGACVPRSSLPVPQTGDPGAAPSSPAEPAASLPPAVAPSEGPWRNKAVFGVGLAMVGVGGAAILGGVIAGQALRGSLSEGDRTALNAGVIGPGAGLALIGGVLVLIEGRRPVKPAAANGAVVVVPVLGVGEIGLRGSF